MDETDSSIDPQIEVKKLQDLVKQLEKQNEVLRGRQKLQLESLQNGEVEQMKQLVTNYNNNIQDKLHTDKSRTKSTSDDTFDDLGVIDVDKLSLKDDEDSWLYSSPKPPTPLQSRVSPYQWLRQEFDHPSPEVESVRRSLLHRLDEAARSKSVSRSSSTPAFASLTTPSPTRGYSPMSQSADGTPLYPNNHRTPPVKKSLASTFVKQRGGIDSGTFTRPKKNREIPSVINKSQEDSPKQDDSNHDDMDNRHPDVADIENLAKQQEESLRQSITQSSPRRVIRSRPPPIQSVSSNDLESNTSNCSSPNYHDGRRDSQSNSITGSDASSPPDSPYGSQYLNAPNQAENNQLRRSLPNVSRLNQAPGFHSSDPYLDSHSSGGSDDYERPTDTRQYSRLQPQARPASPNVSGLRQPNQRRGLSPQRTGLPQPARRSIPRPGSAGTPGKSGIATPRRSGIPSPRPTAAYKGHDESWKDGCF